MIVLASDYVGLEVARFLLQRHVRVGTVILDPSDRGGYNQRIEKLVGEADGQTELASADDLRRPEFLDHLAAASPVVGILAWWPHILKGRLLTIPRKGWLNFHPGLLPDNRGAHPNFWCLADGTPCGVSLHFVDDGVDTGPVVAQAVVETTWTDTGESVYLRCRERALELFRESFDDILSGQLESHPQDQSAGTSHRAADITEASLIDLDAPTTARHVLNVIRARTFPPHPPARFRDGERTYSVSIDIREYRPDD